MEIKRHKKFKKQYKKLPKKVKEKFSERVVLLLENPENKLLNVHELKGKLKNHYSMNVTGDVRAIFAIIDNQIYFFLLIGTHAELYE